LEKEVAITLLIADIPALSELENNGV